MFHVCIGTPGGEDRQQGACRPCARRRPRWSASRASVLSSVTTCCAAIAEASATAVLRLVTVSFAVRASLSMPPALDKTQLTATIAKAATFSHKTVQTSGSITDEMSVTCASNPSIFPFRKANGSGSPLVTVRHLRPDESRFCSQSPALDQGLRGEPFWPLERWYFCPRQRVLASLRASLELPILGSLIGRANPS